MKNHERYVWVGLTAILLVGIAAFAFSPALTAESQPSDTKHYLELFNQVFKSVQQDYVDKVDPKKLFEGAMKGLFDTLNDPHSYYMAQDQVRDLTELTDVTRGQFGGVGLVISKPLASDGTDEHPLLGAKPQPPYVEVVSPIHGSPAYRAGIIAGDRITKIGGVSTADMTMDDVLAKLRGQPGSQVSVTILRGDSISFTVDLVRAVIDVPDVKYAMIPDGIGYLRITQYTALTPSKVRQALDFFKSNNYRSLIIDERGNPGGLLAAVVQVAGYMLPSGVTVVSTRSRIEGESEVYTAPGNPIVAPNVPIVVLIDRGSASAAEILAGALRDNRRALLVGDTSFGKGSVQQVFFLQNGDGAMKLTTARYYTPNGQNIDKIGIIPDKVIKEPELTQAEQDSLKRLVEQNVIVDFARSSPHASDAEIAAFIVKLHGEGIVLGDALLGRLIHSELDRMMNDPPIYNLQYDDVLLAATKIVTSSDFTIPTP